MLPISKTYCLTFVGMLLLLLAISNCKTSDSPTYYKHKKTIGPFSNEVNGTSIFCHTQGIAWCDQTNQLIITCQGEDQQAYILLYPDESNASQTELKTISPLKSISTDAGIGNDHPSATQVSQGVFPVAVAGEKEDPTTIFFYRLTAGNLSKIEEATIQYPKHLGAMAYQTFDVITYLVGVGWDAEDIVVWKTSDTSKTTNFNIIYEGKMEAVSNAPTGPYNSIWLGKIDSTEQITLLTSYGSFFRSNHNYLDAWNFIDDEKRFSLNHIACIQVPGYTKGTSRSLFFEGFTIRKIKDNRLTIWSAPHDFKPNTNIFKMKHIYEGVLEF